MFILILLYFISIALYLGLIVKSSLPWPVAKRFPIRFVLRILRNLQSKPGSHILFLLFLVILGY